MVYPTRTNARLSFSFLSSAFPFLRGSSVRFLASFLYKRAPLSPLLLITFSFTFIFYPARCGFFRCTELCFFMLLTFWGFAVERGCRRPYKFCSSRFSKVFSLREISFFFFRFLLLNSGGLFARRRWHSLIFSFSSHRRVYGPAG